MIKKIKKKTGAVWQVDLRLAGRSSKRLRRRFERKTDAEAFLLEQKRRSSDGALLAERTFTEEARVWLNQNMDWFSPAHRKRMQGIVAGLEKRLGQGSLESCTLERVRKLQSQLLSEGLSAPTVNRWIGALQAVLNHSAQMGRISHNPLRGLKKLREHRREMNCWDRSECEEFLRFASEKYPEHSHLRWVYVVYLLAVNTGVRAAEAWGLRLEDLSRDQRTLHIRRQFDRVSRTYRELKGKDPRQVPCNEVVRRELLALLVERRPGTPVFQSESKGPIDHDNFVKRVFLPDLKEAGMRRIRFHDLRHSATTLLIAQGIDLKTVKEICGHKSIQTTMLYSHLVMENVRKTADVFQVGPAVGGSKTDQPTRVQIWTQPEQPVYQ